MNNKKYSPIYVTYDINFKNKCTQSGVRYLISGLSATTHKSFWVYDRLDDNFIRILNEWINK